MKKLIVIIISVFVCSLLIIQSANALIIQTTDNIGLSCYVSYSPMGCYFKNSDTILLDSKLTGLMFFTVLIHEIGHRMYGDSQETAMQYEKKVAQDLLAVHIDKTYIRYFDSPDVFDYQTGRKISYDEAVKNNIWGDIQVLPFYNRILFGNEYNKF